MNFYQPFHSEWAKDAPYNVSLVKIENGPIFLTNMVECEDSDLAVGMPVELIFDDVTDGVAIPKYRPA